MLHLCDLSWASKRWINKKIPRLPAEELGRATFPVIEVVKATIAHANAQVHMPSSHTLSMQRVADDLHVSRSAPDDDLRLYQAVPLSTADHPNSIT